MKKIKLLSTSIILYMVFLIGCKRNDEIVDPLSKKVNDYSADISYDYNRHYLSIVKHSDGYRPPVSARALAYIGLAAYEAVAPGMVNYQSVAFNFPTLQLPKISANEKYHWGVVANASYQYALRYFVQNMEEKDYKRNDSIATAYNTRFATECDTATFNRSQRFGKEVSYAVYIYSLEDGESNAYRNNKPTDYAPPIGLGLWNELHPIT